MTIIAVTLGLTTLILAKLVMHQSHVINGLERMAEYQRSQLRHPAHQGRGSNE